MNKVAFTYKTGRERMLSKHDAELLRRLGKGTYTTRDMVAGRAFPGASDTRTVEDVGAYIKLENEKLQVDPLADLDADALHALAKERGVKVHHKTGADKVRAALRSAE